MSPAHVLEPTCQEIRRRLALGCWPPGFRLDTARLAAELGTSKSPVRDSLNRLAGERLVDFTPGNGFHVPWIDEQRIRDLLDLSLLLLIAAIGCEAFVLPVPAIQSRDRGRIAGCFHRIGWGSRNYELARAIEGTSERLAAVLRHDANIQREATGDIEAVEAALLGTSADRLRLAVRRYHGIRREKAAAYVFALKQDHRHGNDA